LAFFKIRLRRARLAGALVALGMIVLPLKSLQGSSFSELLFPFLIFPTSLTDPSRRCGTGGKIFGEREIIQLFANDNPISNDE
jgi:hypothetical protein